MDGELTLYTKDDTGGYNEYKAPAFGETLPEDVRENEHLKGFDDAGALAKAYVGLKSSAPVIPESPDKYEIKLPEGAPFDEDYVNELKKIAHENGVTNAAAAKIVDHQIESILKGIEHQAELNKQKQDEAIDALKKEWGHKYDENLDLAKRALKTLGKDIPEFAEWLDNTRMGDDPVVVKFMHKVASLISEDALIGGDSRQHDARPVDQAGRPVLRYPSMEK